MCDSYASSSILSKLDLSVATPTLLEEGYSSIKMTLAMAISTEIYNGFMGKHILVAVVTHINVGIPREAGCTEYNTLCNRSRVRVKYGDLDRSTRYICVQFFIFILKII